MTSKIARRIGRNSLTLGRFVTLPENRFARRAIAQLAAREVDQRSRRKPFPILYLHGPPGTGKSHLVQALLERVISRSPGHTVRSVPARDLGRVLCEPVVSPEDPAHAYRECDVLIVEDIHHLPMHASDTMANLIDHRLGRKGSFVVTSASGPATLGNLSKRLTSRLSAGLVVGLEPLAFGSRRQLAQALVEKSGLRVTDEVIDWLSRQPTGGARPILGDIARLEQLSRRFPPPLELTQIIAELSESPEQAAPTMTRLAEVVAVHFGIKLNQLKGRNRQRQLLWPRHVGMFLARQMTLDSLARIGAFFGGYDHSTVLYACRQVEHKLKDDLQMANEIRLLRTKLE
jgi:chromosomal replication initiator protein